MPSNWILNADGSIYHLRLKPGDLAETILTVGDPGRVESVARRFNKVETRIQSREFSTVTGFMQNQRISVVSTGIGTDNIDIVWNEIDALFNIDLRSGSPKLPMQSLTMIRLGTSGSIQEDLEVDELLITDWSFGLDGLMPFYAPTGTGIPLPAELQREIGGPMHSWGFQADPDVFRHFDQAPFRKGNTLTAAGFYAPQGRSSRIRQNQLLPLLQNWNPEQRGRLCNLEMETSAIYGLSRLMGHRALSVSAILANRIQDRISSQPEKTIDNMIDLVLERVSSLTR